jgi:hypothetical protein
MNEGIAPPVAAKRLIKPAHRSLRAVGGSHVTANAPHRFEAEVQQDLGWWPLGPPFVVQE